MSPVSISVVNQEEQEHRSLVRAQNKNIQILDHALATLWTSPPSALKSEGMVASESKIGKG